MFSGPIGSGKTAALVYEALFCAYENPGLPGMIAAPTWPMLRDVALPAFLTALDENEIPHRYRKAAQDVFLDDCQATVRFRTLDAPERVRGQDLAWWGIDELTYARPGVWLRLEGRLRNPRAKRLCGFGACTPRGFDPIVYERFVVGKVPNYGFVQAEPGENTYLDAGYYESLKHSYDARFYAQEVLGQFLNVWAGQTYYAFDRREHIAHAGFDPRQPLHWALDFNIALGASVLCQRDGETLRVIHELTLPGSTGDHCRAFIAWLDKLPPLRWPQVVYVYGDATGRNRDAAGGRSKWDIVREATANLGIKFSYRVPNSNPAELSRVNAVNWLLRDAAGLSRIVINSRCVELIRDLEQVTWKTTPSGKQVEQIDKDRDPMRTHISDALGYLIAQEFRPRQKAQWGTGFIG